MTTPRRNTTQPGEPPDTLEQFYTAATDDLHAAGYGGVFISVIKAGVLSPETIFKLGEELQVKLTNAERVYRAAFMNPVTRTVAGPMLHLEHRGLIAREMGNALAYCLGDRHAYLELRYTPPRAWTTRDSIVVTIARCAEKTPAHIGRHAERELQRAMTELEKAGVPFVSDFEFRPEGDPELAAINAANPTEENCRIDTTVEPHELFCTLCGARQPYPEYFTFNTYKALTQAFAAEHEGGRCQ